MPITIKTPEEIELMAQAGQYAAEVLEMLTPHVQPGVTTDALNALAHHHITVVQGKIPAPLDYKGFPKSICTSVNHQVCHGIPGPWKLKKGDIINIDVTVIHEGFHGDTSAMYCVGSVTPLAKKLVDACQESLYRGIRAIRPGAHLGDIGFAIQQYVEKQKFSVVRDFCGHGIGRIFHEDPQVLHYGSPGTGIMLTEGMVITVEPMVNAGSHEVVVLADGWTSITKDRRLSAQWEHTIAVTSEGYRILTLREDERKKGCQPSYLPA